MKVYLIKKCLIFLIILTSKFALCQTSLNIDSIKVIPPSSVGMCDATFTLYVSGGCSPYTYNFLCADFNPSGGQCCGSCPFQITDACSTTITDTLKIPCSVSTGQLENRLLENKINIYPNPSNSGVFVCEIGNSTEGISILVTDVSGRKIYFETLVMNDSTVNFNLDVKSGIYFVNITNLYTSENILKKFVIQ